MNLPYSPMIIHFRLKDIAKKLSIVANKSTVNVILEYQSQYHDQKFFSMNRTYDVIDSGFKKESRNRKPTISLIPVYFSSDS